MMYALEVGMFVKLEGRNWSAETGDHVLALDRAGWPTPPVTITVNLCSQHKAEKPHCELFRRQTKEQRAATPARACVQLCSHMIKALFLHTFIHLQKQMYGFALTRRPTHVRCVCMCVCVRLLCRQWC